MCLQSTAPYFWRAPGICAVAVHLFRSEKNEQQTISHTHVQVQKMFEAGTGIFAEGFGMLAYLAVPGHMQMRRGHTPCDRTKGRG
jgi:hypothetical protein